jgi:RND family efflux transporter MFP subunit
MTRRKWVVALTLVIAVSSVRAGVSAITRASMDRTLSFVRPGTIGEVCVQEGQVVKQGQCLIRQDDSAESQQLNQLRAEAEADIRIRAAVAKLDQSKVALEKMESAAKVEAATILELRQAQVDCQIAELSLELERFDHSQAMLKYKETKAQVDRMQLISPIDGKVEAITVREGETVVDAAKAVVRIVKVDPLWIDVPIRVEYSSKLECGQKVNVTYGEPFNVTEVGEIINIASVVESGSGTRRIRIQLANPQLRPAGMHVTVDFAGLDITDASTLTTQPSGAATQMVVKP